MDEDLRHLQPRTRRQDGCMDQCCAQCCDCGTCAKNGDAFFWFCVFAEIVLIVLYAVFCVYGENTTHLNPAQTNYARFYGPYADITVMIFIGFGFLMTFLRRYSFSAVGFTMLVSVFAIQWGILIMGFFYEVSSDHPTGKIALTVEMLIEGQFAAGAVLISFGALIGKITPLQLVMIAFFELIFYGLNFYINILVFGASDVGGSMMIHAFGAYFGLAASLVMSPPRDAANHSDYHNGESSTYVSDVTAMIGTVFLWIYWPSFNSAFAGDEVRMQVVVNTVLSLSGCAFGAFTFSRYFRDNKFDMVDIQNATIAGGVIVGSTADMYISPAGAIGLGFVGSIISTFGYTRVQPFLHTWLRLSDTCGVHNLHGMPGAVGGLASVFAALAWSEYLEANALVQLLALVITLCIASLSGLFVGWVVMFITNGVCKQNTPRRRLFHDAEWWAEVTDSWGNADADILLGAEKTFSHEEDQYANLPEEVDLEPVPAELSSHSDDNDFNVAFDANASKNKTRVRTRRRSSKKKDKKAKDSESEKSDSTQKSSSSNQSDNSSYA